MSWKNFSPKEKSALRTLLIITLVTRLAFAFRPQWQIASRPFNDDAFYMFTVSDHLAHGQGLSVDSIHQTNGIQPLMVYLYTPLFMIAGGDKLLALRFSFILIALIDMFNVLFFAKLVKRLLKTKTLDEQSVWLSPPVIAAALWTFLFPILIHTTNGLETGLYSLCIIASMNFYSIIRNKPAEPKLLHWIGFGALLGVTVLARIDAVFFVIAFMASELWRFRKRGFASAVPIGITAFVVSSPWWIYNYRVFGNIMPQSGQSESVLNMLQGNLQHAAISFGDILSLGFMLPYHTLPQWTSYLWFVTIGTVVFFIAKRARLPEYLREHCDLPVLAPLALLNVMFVIYYIFFFSAPHFMARYFQPIRILWLILAVCSAPALFHYYRKLLIQFRTRLKFLVLSITAAAGIFSFYGYVSYFFVSEPSSLYLAGTWAARHPKEKIGMLQSGTAGFFSANVINLDGKVNSEALHARQQENFGTYIMRENFDYIMDWTGIVTPVIDDARRHGANYERVDSIGYVVIFKRMR